VVTDAQLQPELTGRSIRSIEDGVGRGIECLGQPFCRGFRVFARGDVDVKVGLEAVFARARCSTQARATILQSGIRLGGDGDLGASRCRPRRSRCALRRGQLLIELGRGRELYGISQAQSQEAVVRV
jgi:hypothetical protein